MRGIVNIVVDNGLFLKLITVATYTIHIENDFATPNIQLFSVYLYTLPYSLETIPDFAAVIIMIKIETQCG